MSSPPPRVLRQLLLYWAFGLSLLAVMWCVPITRRLAAALVRLALVSIAPLLSIATEHDPAVPTWMFALCVVIVAAVLGGVFFGLFRLLRAPARPEL